MIETVGGLLTTAYRALGWNVTVKDLIFATNWPKLNGWGTVGGYKEGIIISLT